MALFSNLADDVLSPGDKFDHVLSTEHSPIFVIDRKRSFNTTGLIVALTSLCLSHLYAIPRSAPAPATPPSLNRGNSYTSFKPQASCDLAFEASLSTLSLGFLSSYY